MISKSCLFLLLFQLLQKILTYNDSIPFNWTQRPEFCWVEDFVLTDMYRPFIDPLDVYPKRGCNSDERNRQYIESAKPGLINITYQPRLDFFFPNYSYPEIDHDPARSMTFRFSFPFDDLQKIFNKTCSLSVQFGRADDYHSVPSISKTNENPIQTDKSGRFILESKFKITFLENNANNKIITSREYDFYDYEGIKGPCYFDGFELSFDFGNFDFLQFTNDAKMDS